MLGVQLLPEFAQRLFVRLAGERTKPVLMLMYKLA